MNTKISHLKTLRIYRHLSFFQLFSHIICNRVMKSTLLVASAPYIYNFCRFFPGHKITNWMISNTFNKMFTGGNSIKELQQTSEHLTKQNIPLIIDYCAQGVVQELMAEQSLNENTRLFTQSARWAAKRERFLFSIKLSGLIDMKLLQKYNNAVQLRDKLWSQSCENGVFISEKLYQNFKKIYQGVAEQHYQAYLKQIHNFSGSCEDFKIDQIQFKMNHHPYYLYQTSKNALLLIKIVFPVDQSQQDRMLALLRRLNEILEAQFRNPNDVRVLVDAEQSYIQRAIQSITEQMQQKYNKQKVYIIPTLQNYLKIAKQRVNYELEMVKRRKLHFAVKLVRGAYLVQQTKIASQKNHASPIVSSFESTTDNYLSNFSKVINSGLDGEIFCAGHNQLTIQTLLDIKRRTNTKMRINFAQLFGLGDHLTLLLKRERENVHKLLPWAQTQVMVPYMIRRAQQLSQMRYPLDIQSALLRHELFYRIFPF